MKRKQQINSLNCKTNELRSIFEIAFNSKTSDLYFIDKSFPHFHISFHRDHSIWIRSNNREIKAKRIFKGNSEFCNGLDPILFYFPTSCIQYPLTKHFQNKYFKLNLELNSNEELESYFFKLFKVSGDLQKIEIEKENTNTTVVSSLGIKMDGSEEKMLPNNVMPIFKGNNIGIYTDIQKVDKQKELLGFKRILFIIEPNKKINLFDLFNPKYFSIDINAVSKNLISRNDFEVNGTKICCYVY